MRPQLCSFESRRASEMRALIDRHNADAFLAPSMQEVPIGDNSEALTAIRQIVAGKVGGLILLTGVGTEAMLSVADTAGLRQQLVDAMSHIPLLVRGPKPAAVLKRLNLVATVKAPEPNTWRELIDAIDDSEFNSDGQTVAVQEYGVTNPDLNAAIQQRGAEPLSVPVYRWSLPDDVRPLEAAVRRTVSGEFDALLFTSAQQVRHLLEIAERLKAVDELLGATETICIASIGPTCSAALEQAGLKVTIEATPPKMGPLVRAAIDYLSREPDSREY